MNSICEFILHGVVTGESGEFHVIGRCGDVPIRVGDVFDQLRNEEELPRTIQLVIKCIHAYQKDLPELSPGMTATIDVVGEGLKWLKPLSVLIATQPSALHASVATN